MHNNAFVSPLSLRTRSSFVRPVAHETRCVRRVKSQRVTPRAVVQVNNEGLLSVEPLSTSRYYPDDGLSFQERAKKLTTEGVLPGYVTATMMAWFGSYRQAVEKNGTFKADATEHTELMFSTLLELARRAVENPITFGPYHERVRTPFDYYKFGFDFASVLLNRAESSVLGRDNLAKVVDYSRKGHNVIFLSNHQSEGDPYAIDCLLDLVAGCNKQFCEDMIFMAGDRVRNDPVVRPFSAGRNLLTVYSKKHINDVPELREEKLTHNRRTISTTARMFKEGGKVLWFAPSGGRDRRSRETNCVEVSDFDEGAVDMMRFTALKAGTPCHFFPMALWTYDMLPPPTSVGGADFGEERVVNYIPMHMYIGEELKWDHVDKEVEDKLDRRRIRCELAQKAVMNGYRAIGGYDR